MRTLITGASGFIGKSLMQQSLLGEIHTVSRKPLAKPGIGNVEHIGNLQDFDFLKKLAGLKFDRIIHLAWVGLPNLTVENNALNLAMSKEFLKIMIEAGVKEINLSGSCLEYGDHNTSVTEETVGTNISPFGESKLELLQFVEALGIPYRWLRIFYAYGPNQHHNSLLSAAYESAERKIVFQPKDPALARDFIYVDDVAMALTMLINEPNTFGVFNVGSGKSTGVGQLVSCLSSQMNLQTRDYKITKPSLRADYSKIKEACGWIPQTDPKDGISQFIQWRKQK